MEYVGAAAPSLRITVQAFEVRQGSELPDALAKMTREHPDALFGFNNGLELTYRRNIIRFASENRLPSMHAFAEIVRDGGLMSYAPNRRDLFHHVATYVGKILKGEKPEDLPVQQVMKVEFLINLKTAKALGLTIPLPLLGRADEVIE